MKLLRYQLLRELALDVYKRQGCGGATGSSKVHTEKSIEDCGAEVQKGNAPTERKMQRLFRLSLIHI